MASRMFRARLALMEKLKEVARDVPDWGETPNPQEFLDAIEEFIDAKLDERSGDNR